MISKSEKFLFYLSLFFVAILTSLYFPQNPLTYKYMPLDSSIYQYIGKMINDGYMPYRDVFDHKGPLLHLYYALGYYFHPMIGVWGLEVISLFFSLVLAYQINRKYLRPCFFVLVAMTVMSVIPFIDSIGNAESLSFFPVLYAIWILQKFIEREKFSSIEILLLGFLSSVLLLIKHTLLLPIGIFALYILFVLLREKQKQQLLWFLFYGAIGFFLPLIFVLFWLGINDSLKDFFSDYINFNIRFAQNYKYLNSYKASFNFFFNDDIVKFMLFTCSILIFGFKLFDKTQKTLIVIFILVLLLIFLLAILLCNPHAHYLTAMVPILLVLFSYAIYSLRLSKIVMLLMLVFLTWRLPYVYAQINNYQKKDFLRQSSLEAAGHFIKNHYSKDQKIFSEYFDQCAIYLYADRYSATKYPIVYIAVKVEPDKLIQEFMDAKPSIIIDSWNTYQKYYNPDDYHLVYWNHALYILEHN